MAMIVSRGAKRFLSSAAEDFYKLSAIALDGEEICFSKYKGKMNELVDKYHSKGLHILGFPCNQFGHQENCTNEEILDLLKHVRPGNGFEPTIEMFSKVNVNGKDSHPVFQFLKSSLPMPFDEDPNGEFTANPAGIQWKPLLRSDIRWNFEKFLVDKNGVPFRRYGKKFPTIDLTKDIEILLNQ